MVLAAATGLTKEQVALHGKHGDAWIIINNKVYDVSTFKHPGGAVISTYAGQDATDAFTALHAEPAHAYKHFSKLLVGNLDEKDTKNPAIVADFRQLRKAFEEQGMFRADWRFYALYFAHIVALEVLAYLFVAKGWLGWWAAVAALVTSQIQLGWLQHDIGHCSVFPTVRWSHVAHWFVLGHLKGASATWWNGRHFRHHAKPNVLDKDLDMMSDPLFVWGDRMPKLGFGCMFTPYQAHYWWLFGPPTVVTALFHFENLRTLIKHGRWFELCVLLSGYVRFFALYTPVLGFQSAVILYCAMRLIESHWFTWVTSMNHLPMDIDTDKNLDWLTQQLVSTCNVTSSAFNDWFCGHLNHQIEHHLFPTMPRHNYRKASVQVQALCVKHGLKYEVKGMLEACQDIYGALVKASDSYVKEQAKLAAAKAK
jgi:fatty acid desaturase/predicted heme/steroid binding protein